MKTPYKTLSRILKDIRMFSKFFDFDPVEEGKREVGMLLSQGLISKEEHNWMLFVIDTTKENNK